MTPSVVRTLPEVARWKVQSLSKTPPDLLEYLQPLARDGGAISTGALVPYQGRLLFAILPPRQWGKDGPIWRIPFAGVGGGLRPEESVQEGLLRTAAEELGLTLRLVDSRVTLLFNSHRDHHPLSFPRLLAPRPCYVWRNGINLVTTFQAELADPGCRPVPGGEVEAFLGVFPSQVRAMGEEGEDLERLLAGGAFLEGRDPLRPAVVYPRGTALYLSRYLEAVAYQRYTGSERAAGG